MVGWESGVVGWCGGGEAADGGGAGGVGWERGEADWVAVVVGGEVERHCCGLELS